MKHGSEERNWNKTEIGFYSNKKNQLLHENFELIYPILSYIFNRCVYDIKIIMVPDSIMTLDTSNHYKKWFQFL